VTGRRATRTSAFGVGKRESHDSSDFYARFATPELSDDSTVQPCPVADSLFAGDSRAMAQVPDSSVALVVTSPPYFAGKAYEQALGEGGIPADFVEYLGMLRDVFAECRRVLEPGGRLCVNVANLGRKPFRSLAGDVATILQDDLGLLLRGEIVWIKADGASGNCAWGSWMSPANPSLRDVTERIVVASKGRFDRAIPPKRRQAAGLPWEATIARDDFMAWTLDTWRFQPASAKRVGHPAPFPVELPRRCIELHTYRGDVVLDPFMGAGTTAEAALRTDRRYVGFDLDPAYVALAEERVAKVRAERGIPG
jgi:DNA modification methylase